MSDIVDDILKVWAAIPDEAIVCVTGWAVSVGITQPLKFAFPLGWHPEIREQLVRFVAFTAGFLTVAALMPTITGMVLGIAVGLWSPVAYSLTLFLVKHKWPWLADFLSGDVRGVRSNRK